MPPFNPSYVPSGKANARNPYNKKINNVRLSRQHDTKAGYSADGGEVVEPPIPVDPLRVAYGNYDGNGAQQDIALPFQPDIVFVWADAAQYVAWKADLPWHGRSQRLDAGDSTYNLRRFNGERFENFKGKGFGVMAAYSVAGRKYRYAAIRYNRTKNIKHTSIIGNGVARDLIYTDWVPDATFIKRDSPQPGILTLTGKDPEQTTSNAGALVGAVQHINGGVTLSGDYQVNQNVPPALGEGIEHMAFRSNGAVTAIEYDGDDSGVRQLGFAADFALIVPLTASGPVSVVVTPEAARGISGEAVEGFIGGADLTVPATYNVAGMKYRVLAFRDSGQPETSDAVPVPAMAGIVDGLEVATLTNDFSLSGPCSIEFWGKPKSVLGSKWFMPLLMGGNDADASSAAQYNCGIYGYAADPDGHSWSGAAIRWLQHRRLARERNSPYASINRYNLNSGIVTAVDDAVHMVLVHRGDGLWRLYINGSLAKEHNRSMALETAIVLPDGGAGVSKPLYVLSAMLGASPQVLQGEVYRVQAWDAALTDNEAAALWEQINGRPATIPAARNTWDFRSALPAGVTGLIRAATGRARVALTVTPVSSIAADAAVGTKVADIVTDGTATLSGEDVALLEVAGNVIRTKASIADAGDLNFTVVSKDAGKFSAYGSFTVLSTSTEIEWADPVFKPGTDNTSTGQITIDTDGGELLTATAATGNPRMYFDLVSGATYELETHLEWRDATRVICRRGNTAGLTGTTIFDVTKPADAVTLDRADTFTNGTSAALHYVFIMANGQTAKALPTTRYRRLS